MRLRVRREGTRRLFHRSYSPTIGRYTRPDPVSTSALQPYAYVRGNPVSRVDPFGLVEWSCNTAQLSAGAVWSFGVLYAECTSECVNNRRVRGDYLIGATGPGVGFAIPFELSGWTLEDFEATPDARNLQGSFALRGCSISPFFGFSSTQVTQGEGVGDWSGSFTGGLGLNCYALAGGAKLVNTVQDCCVGRGEPPIITGR
jgi:hypothetical protein